jgi:hypothetical protein
MSILADLFVSSEGVARALDNISSLPIECVAQYRRVTELEFKALLECMDISTVDSGQDLSFRMINVVDYGEQVTTAFPEPMTKVLAKLSDRNVGELAVKWAASELFTQETSSSLEPLIIDLRRLAVLADERGELLYLWNCV